MKSRIPTKEKHRVVRMIKDLYEQYVKLMKNFKRSNERDEQNQQEFTDKLEKMFDLSHADADKLIKNEEDRQFLDLLRTLITGVIGSVDRKLAVRKLEAALREVKKQFFMIKVSEQKAVRCKILEEKEAVEGAVQEKGDVIGTESESDDDSTNINKERKRRQIISNCISAILDRTEASAHKTTIITASVLNEAVCSTSSVYSVTKEHCSSAASKT